MQKLIDAHMIPYCSQFNCQEFRVKRYWNEECDNIYKSHYTLFESLYQSRSGSHRMPGEKKYDRGDNKNSFMAFDEYVSIFSDSGLINDIFTERDTILSFAQSMMTQVDELESDRHMKMQMLEFLEALARAADGLSLAPYESNVLIENHVV